ncbi:piwi-like protein Ago3 isoform X1 [Solenopsis invicta]|nr:piwi-like protein Ago3 isoform X1 [Solenopsis invicta]XP_039307780.1 piwi-like protein Ago3 isoform X1 [Solenopsis invicta]XP_039307790.1 piwi-like protein Ago3 isoform X1 [Solenopsis invicta]
MDRDGKDETNGSKSSGRGRGSFLFEMMRQRAQLERSQMPSRYSVETPSASSTELTRSSEEYVSQSTSSSASGGRGRAQLVNLIRSMSSSASEASDTSAGISGSGIGHGRGAAFTSLVKRLGKPSPSEQENIEKDTAGVLGKLADISVYDTPSTSSDLPSEVADSAPICRQGKSGTKVETYANYIDLKIEPGTGLFQYEVKFSPDIDSTGLRRKLLNQHSDSLGRTKTFDGMILYVPRRLSQDVTQFISQHPMDGSSVTLTIIYRKKQPMSENTQFLNVLLKRIMRALSLVRIGRQNFNPSCAHVFNQHRLEVWPGYVTAVNEYEGGLKLCLDAKHRVMRTETVRDLIKEVYEKSEHNYRDAIMQEIIGTSVLTRYNNKTYRIDDIDWEKTPNYVFHRGDEQMSLVQYYKSHWNIEIEDLKQPLLVHRATIRQPSGEKEEKTILLVPELSYAAGLTDSIRNNHHIMKDLSTVTKISPNQRRDVIRRFIEEIEKNTVAREILSGWGLSLSPDIAQFKARRLDPETISFGNNKTNKPDRSPSDWSSDAVRNPMLRTPNLHNWHILFVTKNKSCVISFLETLKRVSSVINMRINEPQKIVLKDDRTETYLREIQNSISSNVELIVIVFTTNRTDRYSAIKKLCCVQKPVPSQVIISKTINNPSKLKSITEKIALQINCKLGGALWTVAMPLKNSMICGIDVYHSGTGAGARKSVAGFVASLDPRMTKWHSRICMQASNQELVDMLQVCLTSAINTYYEYNKCNPERIIIYRDGVGDGDLDYVEKYEVKQLIATFNRITPNYKPQLSVIIVQKRINTRLFIKDEREGLANPGSGTVVDSCITRRNYYDFFLVPQNVRQGTVTPIHYIVIHDSSNMETDHMQRLTYKLCHLYYNWPGTIRVPAPCQYAHKLVYLVGQNLQAEPHRSLSDVLFYL